MWKVIVPLLLVAFLLLEIFVFQFAFSNQGENRRQGIFWWVIVGVLIFEIYAFKCAYTLNSNKYFLIAYVLLSIGAFLALFLIMKYDRGFSSIGKAAMIMVLIFVPKIVLSIPLIIDDCIRVVQYIVQKIGGNDAVGFPARRKFVAQFALGVASIPFALSVYGLVWGKYNFRVRRKTLYFDDLPKEFDGLTLTQVSDFHCGSFDDVDKVAYGVNLINEQNSDFIFFTGDFVNSKASEMEPYIDVFKKLSAPLGMFAVFGNHDYGHYRNDDNEEVDTLDNLTELERINDKIGFRILRNQAVSFERNGKRLNIVGVENWGAAPYFPKAGDLFKASESVSENDFNVLLSHDPTFFDFDKKEIETEQIPIKEFPKKMHLTLSGHTHGSQFGIDIPGFKWSPVKYFYHKWKGLYEENNRKLYVNIGFGYLAFPGRIGMWPEVTVLTLKRKD